MFGIFSVSVHSQLAPPARRALTDVPRGVVRELESTGKVSRNFDNHRDLRYLPEHSLADRIESSVDDVRPKVISEALMYLDRGVTDEEFLSLYNAFRGVSELSYMEYYNPEKEVWHNLFNESYRIADPEAEEPLPDPIVTSLPARDSFFVGQEIPPFGYIASEYSFVTEGEAFLFSSTNLDRFYYREMPVLAPENMFTHVLVIRGDDYVLAYGVGGARVFTLFGILGDRIETPFAARTSALFDWFYQEQLRPLRE
jgi:hypothetical protein